MSLNADWLKRRNAIDQELGGKALDVADIRLVQNDSFRGSRERGPCARAWGTIGAGAANHHVGLRLDAFDGSAASSRNVMVAVHQIVASQALTVFLANRAALTLTSENPVTPGSLDPDAEVVPRIFEIDFLNTDIPISVGTGVSQFSSAYAGASNYVPPPWLPGIIWFDNVNQQSLFIVGNSAATIFHYNVSWQAIRQ